MPRQSNLEKLKKFRDEQSDCQHQVIAIQGTSVAAAMVPTRSLVGLTRDQQIQWVNSLAFDGLEDGELLESELLLFEYPHEVIDQNAKCFQENLQYRITHGHYQPQRPDIYFGEE